jgi:hypothetical protein
MEERKIIDPRFLMDQHFPLIVLADDQRSFVGWGIKHHTDGNYNHVMIMHRPGFLASQGFWAYSEIPLEKYMNPREVLKFWGLKGLAPEEKDAILKKVKADLEKPWWKRWGYDYLGIVGQFTGAKWIQNPFKFFCSEIVAGYLRIVPELKKVVPQRPSPVELNAVFNRFPDKFECFGYWLSD